MQRLEGQPGVIWAAADDSGLTALHLAAGFAGGAVLSALLVRAACVRAQSGGRGCCSQRQLRAPRCPAAPAAGRGQRGHAHRLQAGATPLHIATFFGDAEAVQLLLAAGASPTAVGASGATPMHYCTCSLLPAFQSDSGTHRAKPHPDIPKLLLDAGGNIFSIIRGSYGQPIEAPLLVRTHIGSAAAASTFLQHAAEQHAVGRWQLPYSLRMHNLVERAASVQCAPFYQLFWRHWRTHKDRKLVHAVDMGLTDVVRELLQEGAHATHGGSWLLVAAVAAPGSDHALLRLLLHHGMAVTASVLGKAVAGDMPQPARLRLLLEKGAPGIENQMLGHHPGLPWTCPILRLLSESKHRAWGVSRSWQGLPLLLEQCTRCEGGSTAAGKVQQMMLPPTSPPTWHYPRHINNALQTRPAQDVEYRRAAAECMEVLAAAGGCSWACQHGAALSICMPNCPGPCAGSSCCWFGTDRAAVAGRCFVLCMLCCLQACSPRCTAAVSGIHLYSWQTPVLSAYDPAREDLHLFQIQSSMAAPTGRRRCCSAGCCAAGAAAVRLSLGSRACLPACQPQLPPLDLSCRWLWDAFTRP